MAWDGGLTLLAPLVAIGMALFTRQILFSLFCGVLVAGLVARKGQIGPDGIGREFRCMAGSPGCEDAGALSAWGSYFAEAIVDSDHLTITAFAMFVAAMIGVMGKSGATETMVRYVERHAKGPRSTMIASWISGLVIFFDDYANCLVVGQSMGPVCDRNRVSRLKLAYIVDSTAAPVASLALVGTWVGYEVGLIDQALTEVGRGGEGFSLFIESLPYRFYSIFALVLVGLLVTTGKDYGPMLSVERRARQREDAVETKAAPPVEPKEGLLAAMPVLTLVIVTFAMMLWQGIMSLEQHVWEVSIYRILEGADPYYSMFAGSLYAFLVATYIGIDSGAINGETWAEGAAAGLRSVLGALAILYLAWALGNGIADTGAAEFLRETLSQALAAHWVPTVTFLLAALTAFSTGTSFGTMSILIPLAVPLAVGYPGADATVLPATTAAVLAGACLGDHASPISDTTVLAAAGTGTDLVMHVRTQMPYALTAGAVAVLFGYIPAGVGIPALVCLPLGVTALYAVVERFGELPETEVEEVEDNDEDMALLLKRQAALEKLGRGATVSDLIDEVAVSRLQRLGGQRKVREATTEDLENMLGTEEQDLSEGDARSFISIPEVVEEEEEDAGGGAPKPLITLPDLAAAPEDEAPAEDDELPAAITLPDLTAPPEDVAPEDPEHVDDPREDVTEHTEPTGATVIIEHNERSTGHRGTWRPDVSDTAAEDTGEVPWAAFDDVAEAAADTAEAEADDVVAWSEAPASTLWQPPEGMGEEDWQAPQAGSTWEGMSEGWRETDDAAWQPADGESADMEQPWVASEDGEWEHEPAWTDESYWEGEPGDASYEDWDEAHADPGSEDVADKAALNKVAKPRIGPRKGASDKFAANKSKAPAKGFALGMDAAPDDELDVVVMDESEDEA